MRTAEEIKALISEGEGLRLEFKRARNTVPSDAYPTVCAFLNTEGGMLLLGVEDDGTISGIESNVDGMLKDLSNTLNNASQLNPPHPIHPVHIEIDGRDVIYLGVPVSSSVHRCKHAIYIRTNEGDQELKEPSGIADLVNKKKQHYFELTPLPYLTLDHLDLDTFDLLRTELRKASPSHLWLGLSNEEILRSALLYVVDPNSGQEVLNMAALLLFGKREAILGRLPAYRIDAIVRRNNTDRYDDRDIIEVNLLQAYLRLEQFVNKHLPDPFYLEDNVRLSLRYKIFREAIGNTLIHREYSKAERTTFVIGADSVVVSNASNPFRIGPLDPNKFSPHPKNPKIAFVFNQLGWVDELGSGVRNIHKYSLVYSNRNASLEEGDTFITTIPIPGGTQLYFGAQVDFGIINPELKGVNYRQFILLTRINPGQTITTQQYKDSLPGSISLTVAKEDLSGLVNAGWLTAPGRGPGARYTRTFKPFNPVPPTETSTS